MTEGGRAALRPNLNVGAKVEQLGLVSKRRWLLLCIAAIGKGRGPHKLSHRYRTRGVIHRHD